MNRLSFIIICSLVLTIIAEMIIENDSEESCGIVTDAIIIIVTLIILNISTVIISVTFIVFVIMRSKRNITTVPTPRIRADRVVYDEIRNNISNDSSVDINTRENVSYSTGPRST